MYDSSLNPLSRRAVKALKPPNETGDQKRKYQ